MNDAMLQYNEKDLQDQMRKKIVLFQADKNSLMENCGGWQKRRARIGQFFGASVCGSTSPIKEYYLPKKK